MKFACCILGFWLVLGTVSIGRAQTTPGTAEQGPQVTSPNPEGLEDFEHRLGPFKIKDQSFTVVLGLKRVRTPGMRATGSEETVARMEIRDESVKVHYQKTFPYEVEGDHFAETTEVSARVLEGSQASGLLVTSDVEPSTPLGGGSYQVFGLFDRKLVPFSKPLSLEGNLMEPDPPSEKLVKTSTEPGLDGEVIRFRVWTGNVFVIVPVRVDWIQAQARPAWRCMKMTPRGWRPICPFHVEADLRPLENDLSFVRVFREADEGMGPAAHVVVKKDSKIEVLEAEGELLWQEDDQGINVGVSGDLWLKVRIDGKEGWIHTQEDFNAIGLPQTG